MTWLFIRFYVGVLLVLLAAWLIYGWVLEQRTADDRARVVAEAHGGGARLVAQALDTANPINRQETLQQLQEEFTYPVQVVPTIGLPYHLQTELRSNDVTYWSESQTVLAPMAGGERAVQLGPFPGPGVRYIEKGFRGWMRMAAVRMKEIPVEQRVDALSRLRQDFEIDVRIAGSDEIPPNELQRIAYAENDVALYNQSGNWLCATSISNGEYLLFGPFPGFQESERPAATATLALVLLPAALAIALLLRPVAQQLRRVEDAAKAIAAGDLSARVDQRKVPSAHQLAHSFNNMAERTETMVRTQRELLQAVSHELRTPLSRMRFAIDLIETAKDDKERRQRLESLDASTEELDELVSELLSYVRMENAVAELRAPEPVDVADALESTLPKYAGLFPTVDFEFADADEQAVIFADRGGFHRALGNLIRNAGRFASERVTVTASAVNGTTTIDVDDDGPGIPPEERNRVFEPFVRLENNEQHSHGVGLGLALVERIVSRNGGSVEVLSSPTGGCRMRTKWPSATAS